MFDPDAPADRSPSRRDTIVDTLRTSFADLMADAPDAFRTRFRTMAADPFAFYRGSAPLFYADVAPMEDPWADDRTSRTWIQGDLHAENFGTYMDSTGRLVFDVNDFDEAYLGHFTWDVLRLCASVALLGWQKALSDDDIGALVPHYAGAYTAQVHTFAEHGGDDAFSLKTDSTAGTVHEVLQRARLNSRFEMLAAMTERDGFERRFRPGPRARRLGEQEHAEVTAAFDAYVSTIPADKRFAPLHYRIKDLVGSKKLQGIADVKDLTDREHGLRLVIEIKNGFVPEAVLEQLYKLTPMEESFGINNVALVDGQPLTLGLKELLEVYLDHRFNVVRRRSEFRRGKKRARLHLVEGLLVALIDIDEVIRLIRSSDNSAQAKERLMSAFSLSEIQTQYILDTPLRRLTKFDRIELESERDRLNAEIEDLTRILESDAELRKLVSTELASVAKQFATDRRTVLLESAGKPTTAVPLEVADDPCRVLLSSTGLLARTATGELPFEEDAKRVKHDVIVSAVPATQRGEVGAVTSSGRLLRLPVIDLPQLPETASSPTLSGGAPVAEFLTLESGESLICLMTLDESSPGLALGTAGGVVKRVVPDYPSHREELEVITLKDGDRVVGACELRTGEEDLVFITDDAQLLRYQAAQVRAQGRPAGGMSGVKLTEGAKVISFTAVDPGVDAMVFTVAGSRGTLDDSVQTTAKITPFDQYPRKGRATGGVRCQRFLKGEDCLSFAWAGPVPARAAQRNGNPAELPEIDPRRDGSGVSLGKPVAAVAGPV